MRLETSAYYALLVPLFALFVGIEAGLGRRRGLALYRRADTLSDLSCGLGQLLVGVFTGPLVLFLYDRTFRHFALFQWDERTPWPWLFAIVGVDFCYYWFHRAGHRIALFWAVHSVHHQSEEYNLAVALRQPWFSDLTALIFYAPLPLLGIGEAPFFAAVALLSIYQVTLHTRLLGRPGRYGYVFNTPSHHRVHHGYGDRYADKNFGATLIIWDRLFGTFAPEDEAEPVRYGLGSGHPGYDPVGAQLAFFRTLVSQARATPSLRQALRVCFGPPRESTQGERRAAKEPPPDARTLAGFLGLLTGSLALLWSRTALPALWLGLFAALLLLGQAGLGRALDGAISRRD